MLKLYKNPWLVSDSPFLVNNKIVHSFLLTPEFQWMNSGVFLKENPYKAVQYLDKLSLKLNSWFYVKAGESNVVFRGYDNKKQYLSEALILLPFEQTLVKINGTFSDFLRDYTLSISSSSHEKVHLSKLLR